MNGSRFMSALALLALGSAPAAAVDLAKIVLKPGFVPEVKTRNNWSGT